MGDRSPWHGRTLEQLGHDRRHDPARCPTCAPTRTEAYARGVAAAQANASQA